MTKWVDGTIQDRIKKAWDAYVEAYPKNRGEPEWATYIETVQEYADFYDIPFTKAHREIIRDLKLQRPEDAA